MAGLHVDAQFHPPLDSLQDDHLVGGGVGGYQPGGEALIPVDASQLGHVAVTHWDRPGDAGVEIVIHADGELGFFLGGTYNGAGLGGVPVPGVVDAIRVADGLDLALEEIGKFPT